MEEFGDYLFKSTIWLTGFAVVYFLFLRNERFFTIKRYFLLVGIVVSIFFPLISFHYQVEVPAPASPEVNIPQTVIQAGPDVQQDLLLKPVNYGVILLTLYLAGVLFLASRVVLQIKSLIRFIITGSKTKCQGAILIENSVYTSSFSFFNYIFIKPSMAEPEAREIINHELVHIRQKHWLDLILIEIVQIFQWINPFAWFYTKFIKINHEYLADKIALNQTLDPAIYKAALVNQLYNAPVISFSNSFSYSLNKKRFDMMKKIINSPFRKLKVLSILPVTAIIFYAFATPEYNYSSQIKNIPPEYATSEFNVKEVKGIILNEDIKPVEGVKIVVTGTYTRATTDATGNFTISNVPEDAFLVISHPGYKTQFIKAEFARNMKILLIKDPDYGKQVVIRTTSAGNTGFTPLIVIDGVITDKGIKDIAPADIAIVNVLRDKNAIDKYGEKWKNGVVEVTTKKKAAELGLKVPFRRQASEDFPTFQGGRYFTFKNWVSERVKYPAEAQSNKLEGNVQVNFTIEADGTVSNVRSTGSANPVLADAIIEVVKNSPKWEPAKNTEAQIPFESSVEIRFKLPDQVLTDEAPFVVVEQMPMYPGGDMALLDFIKANTKYPDSAKAMKTEGRVIVRFCVNTEGKTERISVLKGIAPLLDAEAVRVVSMLSGFTPGMQGGKPVNVWYMIPVTFPPQPVSNETKLLQEVTPGEAPFEEGEVDKMPEYPGGVSALLKFIAENTQYPEQAKAEKIQGRVIVKFVITKDGDVSDITVLKSVHPLLDAEATRVVSLLPKWQPGTKGGKSVDVWFTVPITFTVK